MQVALAAAGIPHRVLGSLGLYERAEVRDALAHLALLANPRDAQAFRARRPGAAPRRRRRHAARVVAAAREHHGGDLITASADAHTLSGVRSQAARDALAAFGAGLEAVRAQWRAGRSLGHVVVATVTLDGGLVAHHQRAPRPLAAAGRAPRRRARARGPALALPRRRRRSPTSTAPAPR